MAESEVIVGLSDIDAGEKLDWEAANGDGNYMLIEAPYNNSVFIENDSGGDITVTFTCQAADEEGDIVNRTITVSSADVFFEFGPFTYNGKWVDTNHYIHWTYSSAVDIYVCAHSRRNNVLWGD